MAAGGRAQSVGNACGSSTGFAAVRRLSAAPFGTHLALIAGLGVDAVGEGVALVLVLNRDALVHALIHRRDADLSVPGTIMGMGWQRNGMSTKQPTKKDGRNIEDQDNTAGTLDEVTEDGTSTTGRTATDGTAKDGTQGWNQR